MVTATQCFVFFPHMVTGSIPLCPRSDLSLACLVHNLMCSFSSMSMIQCCVHDLKILQSAVSMSRCVHELMCSHLARGVYIIHYTVILTLMLSLNPNPNSDPNPGHSRLQTDFMTTVYFMYDFFAFSWNGAEYIWLANLISAGIHSIHRTNENEGYNDFYVSVHQWHCLSHWFWKHCPKCFKAPWNPWISKGGIIFHNLCMVSATLLVHLVSASWYHAAKCCSCLAYIENEAVGNALRRAYPELLVMAHLLPGVIINVPYGSWITHHCCTR